MLALFIILLMGDDFVARFLNCGFKVVIASRRQW